jgi:hypothetical protein
MALALAIRGAEGTCRAWRRAIRPTAQAKGMLSRARAGDCAGEDTPDPTLGSALGHRRNRDRSQIRAPAPRGGGRFLPGRGMGRQGGPVLGADERGRGLLSVPRGEIRPAASPMLPICGRMAALRI